MRSHWPTSSASCSAERAVRKPAPRLPGVCAAATRSHPRHGRGPYRRPAPCGPAPRQRHRLQSRVRSADCARTARRRTDPASTSAARAFRPAPSRQRNGDFGAVLQHVRCIRCQRERQILRRRRGVPVTGNLIGLGPIEPGLHTGRAQWGDVDHGAVLRTGGANGGDQRRGGNRRHRRCGLRRRAGASRPAPRSVRRRRGCGRAGLPPVKMDLSSCHRQWSSSVGAEPGMKGSWRALGQTGSVRCPLVGSIQASCKPAGTGGSARVGSFANRRIHARSAPVVPHSGVGLLSSRPT